MEQGMHAARSSSPWREAAGARGPAHVLVHRRKRARPLDCLVKVKEWTVQSQVGADVFGLLSAKISVAVGGP